MASVIYAVGRATGRVYGL